ncbi:lipase [Chlorella sorokiniana]|uniref:Lipase n=1 Tax=Chlorella sorokiniana TaxID=3076 RepID=A0A2P6TG77_CHLSO|nr:lipase [Chlorella sorokiniana]|eukprot:PRW33116.1 lipase [Chlorella sorokiniana]
MGRRVVGAARALLLAALLCAGLASLPAHAQGLLGLLGGGGGSSNMPTTKTTGPQCANTSAAIKAALAAVPAPAANQLCDTLLDSPINTCNLGAMVEWGLTSTASEPPKCNGALKQEVPPGEPAALQDLRPLPYAGFDNATDLLELEGETYFWLYRTLLNFEAYLGCFIANGSSWEPPSGWQLHSMLNVTEPASNTAGAPAGATPGTVVLPFAAVLLNQEEQQLVIAVRGTMTAAEWGIDFSYNQTALVAALGSLPVHYGFAGVFQQLWPGVQAALDELVVGGSPAATQVFVTGHSLGAGVGTLLSYATQSYLNEKLGAAAPVVGAVLVAPPNAGSPQFVDAFNTLVNARRLAFEYDIVPQAFCTPEMPSCPPGRLPGTVGALLTAAGISITPTDQPGNVTAWPYAQIGGSITLLPDEMAQDAASWPALSRIQLCWALPFLLATHVCSYSCALSQYAAEGAAGMSMCWLSSQPAGAPGTACPGWPTNYPGL